MDGDEQPVGSPPMASGPTPFHVMAKPTGAVCNLDCEYCFFLSKDQLYPGSGFRMVDDLQEAYIRQVLEAHAGLPEVVVTWQGGEPTMMGLEFFRRSVELERRHARPDQTVRNALQTNGTLLDDEWGRFLADNGFLVGISIDGPRDLHDAYRVDKGGRPTFDRVIRGLDVLKRHHVDWNVLTAVHAANGDHGTEVYRFLRDELDATFIQFIPVVERGAHRGGGARPLYTQTGSLVTHRSVGPEQFGRFMIDVFEEWVRHDIGTVYVQMFDSALANWYGEPGAMCVHAETCGEQLVLEHNGDVYSCDHYVEPGYLLGNISDRHLLELVDLPQQRKFGADKRDTLTAYCRDCDVRFACNGGCPKDRFATSPYGEPGQNYLCPGYEAFFRHVRDPMEAMARLLRQGRAPAELMDAYAASDARRPPDARGNRPPSPQRVDARRSSPSQAYPLPREARVMMRGRREERREARRGGDRTVHYKMRQRLVSIGDDFWIETDTGERAFKVDGKALRLRKTLIIEDAAGRELATIREKVARLKDSMEVEGPDGRRLAMVKKAMITPLRDRWAVKIADGPDLEVQGNVLDHEYTFTDGRTAVATVSKKWFRVADTYGVEVAPDQDQVAVLAATVAIDMMAHEER